MHTYDEIYAKLADILVADFECPRDAIKPDARLFEDLDLDSIDAVDLIVRLQKIVDKKVDPQAFKQIRTLGDVATAIEQLVNQ
ncbi:MAG: acyl carrier protein [Kiritimatiellia bacterium]|nr:acyl carrier protein [Kiritimatiellia bacterium]